VTEPDDDLTVDIQLRPIDEVARRMVILASLIQIALTLTDPDDDRPPAQIEQELDDLADALLIGELSDSLSSLERRFLHTERGRLEEDAVLEMLWRVEALAALSSATTAPATRGEAPWRQSDPAKLISAVPAPWDEINAFVATLSFQPEEDIAALREAAELWMWRSAIDDELRSARGQAREEIRATVREVAHEADQAGLLGSANGDFLVDREPYHRVDDETKAIIAEISLQRLWALNWLCGYGDSWDDVPLDV